TNASSQSGNRMTRGRRSLNLTEATAKATTVKELREFAYVTGGISVGWFGIVLPLLRHRAWPIWPWVLGVVLAGTALAAPSILKPLFRVWTWIGHVLGWI